MDARKTAVNLLKGLATQVPGLMHVRQGVHRRRRAAEHATVVAQYCVSVWLRHIVLADQNGLDVPPQAVLELGPGDTLGVGLAALLTGANTYVALDTVSSLDRETDDVVFQHLVAFFRGRHSIPDDAEFARLGPALQSYDFPDHILPQQRIDTMLDPARLWAIHSAFRQGPRRTDRERPLHCAMEGVCSRRCRVHGYDHCSGRDAVRTRYRKGIQPYAHLPATRRIRVVDD